MSEFVLRSARYLAAECMERVIQPGDTVIDATMGNGHDTEKLAALVGEGGHVYAFDVQEQAVACTRERLQNAGLLPRATLILDSHAEMARYVKAPVRAVIFNLGWLPGGDKSVTTRLDSTLRAVNAALDLLLPMGVLILCVYPGHAEGKREREALLSLFAALPPQKFNCLSQRFLNAGDDAPLCVIVQRQ